MAELSILQSDRTELRHGVSLRAAFWVWLRVALLSFGGPAGQIAVMHRILIEEKRWIYAQWAASIVVAACIACSGSRLPAQEAPIKVDIARNDLGMPPADFELARTGEGELGQWTVVRDPTAIDGLAIEHLSTDQHDDRFPLAIYKPLNAENVEVSVRFKIISGTLQSAGVAVCLRNPASYYAVSASALEHRVDLLLVMNGRIERIETSEAEVALNRWHSLRVTVNDDHFVVSLDKQVLFTTFERTRMKDGHVALWTQEDNVTRFDQIEIRPLPSPEVR